MRIFSIISRIFTNDKKMIKNKVEPFITTCPYGKALNIDILCICSTKKGYRCPLFKNINFNYSKNNNDVIFAHSKQANN
jgi:hypothetical protein